LLNKRHFKETHFSCYNVDRKGKRQSRWPPYTELYPLIGQ